jgi:hypothetical protein
MPKRKITLEEAFAVFEQHGLQVEVKAVQIDQPQESLYDFLEVESVQQQPVIQSTSAKSVKITLYATHTIGSGGEIVLDTSGNKAVINNCVESYGPGVVTVPARLAQHLLHADMLARHSDENLTSSKMRSFVVVPRVTPYGVVNCSIQVSEDRAFDMSSFLGALGNSNLYTTG